MAGSLARDDGRKCTWFDRSAMVDMIFRAQKWPFSPSGEKVADRPDEGACEHGSVLNADRIS